MSRFMSILGNGIQFAHRWVGAVASHLLECPSESIRVHIREWNSVRECILNTPAFQQARGECREQRVFVGVVVNVGVVTKENLTIKITSQRMNI